MTISQSGVDRTCTTTGVFCVVTDLTPGTVTASVVAVRDGLSSSRANGTGTVGALSDMPPSAPANTGGASVELRTTSGQAVSEAAPGQTLLVVASGFAPHSTVDVFAYSTPQHLGAGLTGATGVATITVVVPANLAPGGHTFVAAGLGGSGATTYAATEVRVTALATTGADVSGVLSLGALLLLAGLAMTFRARNRKAVA